MSPRKKRNEEALPPDDSSAWMKHLQDTGSKTEVTFTSTAEAEAEAQEKPLYKDYLWKGVKTVFLCEQCPHNEDREDDMKLHVLTHYPEEDRAVLLDKLTKEK